jgi:hypothetical protein
MSFDVRCLIHSDASDKTCEEFWLQHLHVLVRDRISPPSIGGERRRITTDMPLREDLS